MRNQTVIYSTLTADAIKERVLAKHDLGDSVECSFFHRGLNDTYVVNSDGRHLAVRLYRHRWRTEAEIRGEIAALLHLDERGVALAAPVATTDGEWLTPVEAPEGQRWA